MGQVVADSLDHLQQRRRCNLGGAHRNHERCQGSVVDECRHWARSRDSAEQRPAHHTLPSHDMVGVDFDWSDPSHSHLMLSDDHGSSWRIGGILDAGTSESAVVETAEAAVYINCRNQRDESLMPYRRARAWSHDGARRSPSSAGRMRSSSRAARGASSASRKPQGTTGTGSCSPIRPPRRAPEGGHSGRRKMTVRVSYDECRT